MFRVALKSTDHVCKRPETHRMSLQALGVEIKQSPSHSREGDDQSGALSKGTLCPMLLTSFKGSVIMGREREPQRRLHTDSNTLLLFHKVDA